MDSVYHIGGSNLFLFVLVEQEAVLTLLERRHLFEQERLYEMLSDKRNEGLRKEAALISGVQRDDRLAELRGKLQQIPTGMAYHHVFFSAQ